MFGKPGSEQYSRRDSGVSVQDVCQIEPCGRGGFLFVIYQADCQGHRNMQRRRSGTFIPLPFARNYQTRLKYDRWDWSKANRPQLPLLRQRVVH